MLDNKQPKLQSVVMGQMPMGGGGGGGEGGGGLQFMDTGGYGQVGVLCVALCNFEW